MSEQSIASARASVMVYDEGTKKWVPSGSSSGLSKVHLYQNMANNTFRVVGRKLQDHEVVINCAIGKHTKYNQATPTFHQWRDNRQVYGLNFSSREDADGFLAAISRAQEILTHLSNSTPPRPPPSLPVVTYQDRSSLEDPHSNWNNNDPRSQNQYASTTMATYAAPPSVNSPYASTGNCQYATAGPIVNNHSGQMASSPNNFPSPNGALGHHRSASASSNGTTAAVPPPPPPPPPPGGPAPPPPPPPPPPAGAPPSGGYATMPRLHSASSPAPVAPPPPTGGPINLATALANAKLKKTKGGPEGLSPAAAAAEQQSSLRATPMASMMDEMAKTLARRRAQAENTHGQGEDGGPMERKPSWESHNDHSPSKNPESPKLGRSPLSRHTLASLADGGGDIIKANGTTDPILDKVKQEILAEMRLEFNKLRLDIIEAIRTEFNRR